MLERMKWPGLTVALAVLCGAVRRWQIASAYEETQGLVRPGAPASVALVAMLVLSAAACLLLARSTPCRVKKESRMCQWDFIFAAEGDGVYLTLMVLAGLVTLAATPVLFRECLRLVVARKTTGGGDNGMLQLVLSFVAIPTAMALISSARSAARMKGLGRENGSLLVPVALGCVWMLEAYRGNAADPALWHYVPLLLAIAAGTLFALDCAGLSYELGHPRRMLWLAAMTVVTSAVALFSGHGAAMNALLAGQGLAALAALWVAPGNMTHPPAEDRFGLRARLKKGLPLNEEEYNEREDDSSAQEIQEEDTHV